MSRFVQFVYRYFLSLLCAIALGVTSTMAVSQEAQSPLSTAEMQRGKILFLQCRACHALTPGDNGGKIGPSLAGVFGREAGSAPYFDAYSAALKDADHVWSTDTMDRWLSGPADMVPGTSMVFAGIADEQQRQLLVRYLAVVTAVGDGN